MIWIVNIRLVHDYSFSQHLHNFHPLTKLILNKDFPSDKELLAGEFRTPKFFVSLKKFKLSGKWTGSSQGQTKVMN